MRLLQLLGALALCRSAGRPAARNASFHHSTAESSFTLTNLPPTVALHASFLSPVTPADVFRQSIPFSYLYLTVESLDGQPHDVEVYSEVNGLWLADAEDEELEWEGFEPSHGRDWVGARAALQKQRVFEEEWHEDLFSKDWVPTDRILHGELWYAAQAPPGSPVGTTFAAGDDAMLTRRAFAKSGLLASHTNSTFRPTRTRSARNASLILDEPVFALVHAFGRVGAETPTAHREAVVALGHVRDPIVQIRTGVPDAPLNEPLRPLWASTFSDAKQLVSFVMKDFETARRLSNEFNAKLYADAREVESHEYGNVVSVSTRQVFMALEGGWDQSQEGGRAKDGLVAWSPVTGEPIPAVVMLKEISSNGNVQTIDVIAPFLPFLLYAAPTMLPLLAEPIYRYMATGLYTPVPPTHDLGDHYPNATGHDDFLYPGLPIEEAGNMLCMALAGMRVAEPSTAPLSVHQRLQHLWDSASDWAEEKRTGSTARRSRVGWEAEVGIGRDHRREAARMARSQARDRYELLKKWAVYLEENGLYPGDQRTTDDFFGSAPNQTSLVVKAIAGLRSMSEIAGDLGHTDDQQHYLDVSTRFRDKFLELALAKDGTHLLGTYNNQTSWVTHYNLYFDKLLGLNIFPASIYAMLDKFYPTHAEPYGPALDSRFPTRAKTDWLAWASALFPPRSPSRTLFLHSLASYLRQSRNAVFGDSITPQEGWSVGFLSRPVAGGHYALLGRAVMEQAAADRLRARLAAQSGRMVQLLAALGAGAVCLVAWRAARRCRRHSRKGYVELGASSSGRRGSGVSLAGRRGSEGVWLAESPRSVFELESVVDEDEDDERRAEAWSRGAARLRGNSYAEGMEDNALGLGGPGLPRKRE
ncbi:hypothetical protein Rhopal_003654-T1 [Rhodotorula paludigena]|uniref:Glutaminase n=1 Tax=Rhodotorula paludigena TaxID=86838 RepID=A0AAV5GMQ7_9BASI|nr:hypothetical protein Rhopal_003654-T1 [Rhodotorula paludigena]